MMRSMLLTMNAECRQSGALRTMRRYTKLLSRIVAVSAIIVIPVGCSTERVTSDGRPMPPAPRAAPATPKDSQSNALAMLVGFKAVDTNGNNYPDLITVQTYLYAKPHPTSMYEDGTFVFELYKSGGNSRNEQPLLTWRYEKADVDQAKMYSHLFERGYTFKLSLLDHGSDQLPLTAGNLIGRFEPADGREPIRCVGVRTIQLGRTGGSATASAN